MIVRQARSPDVAAMTALLNQIIALGGTTAHQDPMSPQEVADHYVSGPDVLSSVVAEDEGRVIGWQSVSLWRAEAHIGTFVQPGLQAKGAGQAMFALTCDTKRQRGMPAIIASIRADNLPGLAYYARLGFVDVAHEPDFALNDGRVVRRVHRRFDLV